jgi:hypothetical protein
MAFLFGMGVHFLPVHTVNCVQTLKVVSASVKIARPWRWFLAEERAFLVAAITFVRKG